MRPLCTSYRNAAVHDDSQIAFARMPVMATKVGTGYLVFCIEFDQFLAKLQCEILGDWNECGMPVRPTYS